jgi:hypothetical protein
VTCFAFMLGKGSTAIGRNRNPNTWKTARFYEPLGSESTCNSLHTSKPTVSLPSKKSLEERLR